MFKTFHNLKFFTTSISIIVILVIIVIIIIIFIILKIIIMVIIVISILTCQGHIYFYTRKTSSKHRVAS